MLQINASIARHNQRIWCAYRTRHLNNFDSESYITELNENLEAISDKRLFAENGNTAFEDIRLFSVGESLLAFYNYHPLNEDGGWHWKYAVGFGVVNIETGLIKDQISLRSLSKRYHEKNWVPYIYNGRLFMITDFDPFLRIIELGQIEEKIELKEVFMDTKRTLPWDFGEIRGGTPLIAPPNSNDGWLYGFVHSFLDNYNGFSRYYFFTAVRFSHVSREVQYCPEPLSHSQDEPDENYKILWSWSNNRSFKVIFPMGIINNGDGIEVSFGVDDVVSCTEYYSWDYIVNLF